MNIENHIAWHLYEFTRFSNLCQIIIDIFLLDTFTNLQGSQTPSGFLLIPSRLDTFTNLQGSQAWFRQVLTATMAWHLYEFTRFSNCTYGIQMITLAWHLYEFTRFSNTATRHISRALAWHLYEFTRFSNFFCVYCCQIRLDTFTNLQGSQTAICPFQNLL